MGARSIIAVVVCTAAATALAAVADGTLVLLLDQPGQELPIATTPDPDVSATPGRLAPRPLLTAVVRAPRHTTDLAAPSERRAVVTGGTSREAVGKMAKGSGAGRDTADGSGTAQNSSATFGTNDEIRPQLRLGSSGPDVADLQTHFNASGSVTACDARRGCVPPAPLNVDGKFGPKTLARVREFQRANALPSDGIVGPQTWKKLVTP